MTLQVFSGKAEVPFLKLVLVDAVEPVEWRQDHPEVCHRVPELGNVGRHLKFVGVFRKLERGETFWSRSFTSS